MPISWNEIRHNAIKFSGEWKGAKSESAEKQTFWNEFFQVFGIKRRVVASWPRANRICRRAASARLPTFTTRSPCRPPWPKPTPTWTAPWRNCYRHESFDSDRQRVEFLFALYEKLTAPLLPAAKAKRTRRSR